jgi:hypothetical protein
MELGMANCLLHADGMGRRNKEVPFVLGRKKRFEFLASWYYHRTCCTETTNFYHPMFVFVKQAR